MLCNRRQFVAHSSFLLALLLSACATGPLMPHAASKSQWLQALPEPMSDEFCNADSAYLRCYPLSKEDCSQQVRALTVDCEQHYDAEMPDSMGNTDMTRWGGRIGTCAEDSLIQNLKTKFPISARTETLECQEL